MRNYATIYASDNPSLDIGGSTQSADLQKGRDGVVMAYLVDIHEL